MSRQVIARVDLDAMTYNMRLLKRRAPDSRLLAVLKSDAYGHGIEQAGRALIDADGFGVASQGEAERLRAAGLDHPIVLFGGFDRPEDVAYLAQMNVRPVIHHPAQIAMLEGQSSVPNVSLWVKVDSGMNRLGFPPEELEGALARLKSLPNVNQDIVLMTHFAASDEPSANTVTEQVSRFNAATASLGLHTSLANSAAVLDHPLTHSDWNRPGGALYGLSTKPGVYGAEEGLRPAMRLSTRLVAIREKEAGTAIGYGGAYRCAEKTRVGVAAIGYGDGYPRHAEQGTPVLIHGVRCPLIGRVSMDLVTINLNSVPNAQVGDEVVLWGDGLSIEEVARHAGTISYELSCVLTRRVQYRYCGGL